MDGRAEGEHLHRSNLLDLFTEKLDTVSGVLQEQGAKTGCHLALGLLCDRTVAGHATTGAVHRVLDDSVRLTEGIGGEAGRGLPSSDGDGVDDPMFFLQFLEGIGGRAARGGIRAVLSGVVQSGEVANRARRQVTRRTGGTPLR